MYSQLHGWKLLVLLCTIFVTTTILVMANKISPEIFIWELFGTGIFASANTILKKHNAEVSAQLQQLQQQQQQTPSSPYPPDFPSSWH